MKKGRVLFLLLYLLPLSLLALVATRLFSSSYHEFTAYLAAALQKPEWEKFIRLRFTLPAFEVARWVIVTLTILYLAAGVYFIRKRDAIIKSLDIVFISGIKRFHEKCKEVATMPCYARWLLVLLLAFVAIKAGWYIINWPLQYDEVWTYNYYIGNSFWQSFLLPHNNHILFTMVAWFFHWLPLDPQISMRLPNLFGGLILVILFFFFIKRNISLYAALFSTFWLATCSPVVFYMLYARGYLFILLFTLIALWIQFQVVQGRRIKLSGTALIMAIVLGYWSNPVFLYPHAAIGLTMIFFLINQKNKKLFWQNIFIHTLSVVFVLILYLPTLLSSHIHDLMNVGVKHSFEPGFILQSFDFNAKFIFGFRYGYVFLILAIVLFVYASLKQKSFGFLHGFVVVSFVVIALFSFLQSIPLAGHIAIFISISIAIMLAIIFRGIELKTSVNKIILTFLLAAIVITNSILAHHQHWFNWSVQYDKSAKKIAALMIEKNISSCYLTVNYYKPHLEYFYKIKGKKLLISLKDSVSQDFRDFKANEQEIVITRNHKPSGLDLKEYREYYKDETITAFIRKDISAE